MAYKSFLLSAVFISAACAAFPAEVSINPDKTFQTIDNFAAADAWSGNFVGQYFDAAQKERLAKWLFSRKLGADGNPEGIGLSMWRVNLGGGTLEQDGADIVPLQRRAESFLTKDGKGYDWGKCAGQRFFMKKAKEYGCEKFLLFSNTPPVQFTKNGKGYADKGKFSANLKEDCYGKFADYLADAAKHFQDEGYNIAYISPINEPQGRWDSNRQEGSPWLCSEMKKCVVELDRAISEKNVKTKILFGETAHPKYNYKYPEDWHNKSNEQDPHFIIQKFFDKNGKFYIGDLKSVPKFIAGHSYHTHLRNSEMEKVHREIAKSAAKCDIGYHQSEWCLLGAFKARDMDGFTPDWQGGNRADIQSALLMGRIIYSDFVNAAALSWGYWKAMEINGDFALTSVYPKDGDLRKGGSVSANKLLWALGNFSLFVRPQYVRIELAGADNLDGTAGVAFKSPDGRRIVAVFVNSSFSEEEVGVKFDGARKDEIEKVAAFRTDANSDLANVRVRSKDAFVIAPRSITTVVFDFKK